MSTEGKMTTCKHCGAEIAASAKVCPKCGGKNKKPIYKRIWFWMLVVLVLLGIIGSAGSKEEQTTAPAGGTAPVEEVQEEAITYTACTVSQLMDALEENALKASEEYKGQYLEITGRLGGIDSSGDYITLLPEDDEFAFIGVQCYIKNEEQKSAVMELSVGDTLTIQGKITDVGEVLGYFMDIEQISAS